MSRPSKCKAGPLGAALGGCRLGPPQQGPHPGHQLAGAERLGQVVVGAQLKAQHLVGLFAAGCEHQHRQLGRAGLGAQALEHPPAVQLRQHHIQDHCIGALGLDLAQSRFTVIGAQGAETGFFQIVNNQVHQVFFIINDKDLL
jgi:hypothetical protein